MSSSATTGPSAVAKVSDNPPHLDHRCVRRSRCRADARGDLVHDGDDGAGRHGRSSRRVAAGAGSVGAAAHLLYRCRRPDRTAKEQTLIVSVLARFTFRR